MYVNEFKFLKLLLFKRSHSIKYSIGSYLYLNGLFLFRKRNRLSYITVI